jgi:hypothetical protein
MLCSAAISQEETEMNELFFESLSSDQNFQLFFLCSFKLPRLSFRIF